MPKHSVFCSQGWGKWVIIGILSLLLIPICEGATWDYSITKDIDELPYSEKIEDFSVTASLGSVAELTTNCDWITLDQTKLEFIEDETEFFSFDLRIPETLSGTYNCTITATVSQDGREKSADFTLLFDITNIVKRYDLTIILTDLMTRGIISNGTLILNTPTSVTGITNQDGAYTFNDVEEGCWDILPSAEGYQTERNFVCISRPTTWIVELLSSDFNFNNATQDELRLYEQYLTEKQLRMYMNMKQHQPRVIEKEKIVYTEVPYSPEAFEKWIEMYNPQSFNDTLNDLNLIKEYNKELMAMRSDYANQTLQLQNEIKDIKTGRNLRWFLGITFFIFAIIGLIIFIVVRRRRLAGYIAPY